jgi:hypothetical protein
VVVGSSARALPVIADAAMVARRIFFTLMLLARVVVLVAASPRCLPERIFSSR